MQNNDTILAIRQNAKTELMNLKTVEEGMEHLNKIKGIEAWAKAEKLDAELQVIVREQSLRTQRILGKLLEEGKKNGEIANPGFPDTLKQNADSTQEEPSEKPKTLAEIGLTKKQSSNFQKLAAIPEEVFEDHIAEAKAEVETAMQKLTVTGTAKLADTLNGKKEAMKAAQAIGEKIEMEKKVTELLAEINSMPVLYRLKIKEGIKK